MPNRIAEAFAPATVANLGVGFDILGLALPELGDTVRVERRDEPGVEIVYIEGDGGKLSWDAAENTASVAAMSVLKSMKADFGVSLSLYKKLPLGSGLGSSAASAVAGAFATNALFDNPMLRKELLGAALDGEAVASGYHVDNVGPCLFGGITLFTEPKAESLIRLPVPVNFCMALVTPNVVVKTADARAVLPTKITLEQMVKQTGAVAKLIDALHNGNVSAIASAMTGDCVIEPARAHLMPHYQVVRDAALAKGAYSMVISGAGPTLLAICDEMSVAAAVAAEMQSVYARLDIESITRHCQVSLKGAYVTRVIA